MREKVIITTFTDPMMGISWECEPLFRKLETHFAGQIKFRAVMALLVRNVRDFMTPGELTMEPEEGIRRFQHICCNMERKRCCCGALIIMTYMDFAVGV